MCMPPPYRWQRCQALLYPHMLLLSWIAAGGGRGIVTLDLLNCTEVRSAASPTHHAAQDDIGTMAAIVQSHDASTTGEMQLGEAELVQTLCPFQLLYSDGIERLGADSPRERVRWVSAIWDVLDRAVSIPDRSATGSPTGSIRTVRSFASTASAQSGSGSASTRYFPHIDNIPDISDLQSISGSSTHTGISRHPSLASAHRTRATDDSAVSNQAYLYPGDPRVIGPSRSSSLRRTSSLTDLDEEFASAVRRARDARPGLGFGLGLAGGIPVGDGSPVTVSSGPRLGRNVYISPPPSVGRGSDKARSRTSDSATSVSDDAFFTAGSASNGSRTQTSSFYSSSSFTHALTTTDTRTSTGLNTDDTTLDIVSGTGTDVITSTLSFRGTTSTSMLGDSRSGSGHLYASTSPSRSSLSRAREIRRRTPRSSSRTYSSGYMSSTEDSSDKENSGSYTPSGSRSVTDEFSTLESYIRTDTYTPTPSSYTQSSSESASTLPRSTTASESSEYVTANTPSELSFVSLPTIPSLASDYETAETCSTEYETAPKCPTEPSSEYETAELCPTEPSSEYITAELCPSEASTEYNTAECKCAKPEEEPEEDVISVVAPSAIPTIPSPPGSIVEMEPGPEDIPLPLSIYSPSVTPRELLEESEPQTEIPIPSPSLTEPSEPSLTMESIEGPSPIATSLSLLEVLPSVSSVSTATESSVTPTPSSMLTLTVPSTFEQPTSPSSPAIPESLWASESDESYESSMLRASPSVQSLALAEGADTSFETSFLRPSGSVYSSEDVALLTPITEVSTASSVSIPSSPSSSLTPTPSSISLPPSVPSPTPISTEEVAVPPVTLTRTPSSVSTVSSVSMSSSIFEPRSLFDFPLSVAEPSTEPSLLSTARAPTSLRSVSPASVPLPPSPSLTVPSVTSPSLTGPPSVTMSVSISTPHGDIPSVMSNLETIPSEAPSHILTHDVNRLLQYLNEVDGQRGVENRDIARNIEEIRQLLEELRDNQPQPQVQSYIPELPPPVPHKDKSVGGSSIISSERSVPAGPRRAPEIVTRLAAPRLIPIPLSPPPIRLPSPYTETETMSFLSSHHSDDLSLLESESYPAIPPSPSWPSSPSYSPESSPPSTSISMRSLSPPPTLPSATPTPPPSSPTPSSASSGTARPVPPVNLTNLRDALASIREEMGGLREGQTAANEALNELRSRPVGQDISDCCRRIEDAIQRLLEQPQYRQRSARDDVSESLYPSGSETSLLDHLARLREEVGRDLPPIQMPTPVRVGPSFVERLVEMLADGPPPAQQPLQPPPPLIPLTYRPGPRVARPRSASPIFEADLPPRPSTFPISQPVIFESPSRRPPRIRSRAQFAPPPTSEGEAVYTPRVVPSEPGMPRPSGRPESDIDFDRAVRDRRRRRRPDARDGFWPGQPPPAEGEPGRRPPTAPPALGIPASTQPPAPPPQFPATQAMPPPGTFIPVAPPPAPTILQIPFDEILAILRENRAAHIASIEQISEVMRYLRDFNTWHGRDVDDRHAEMRGLNARIDQIGDILNELLRRAEGMPASGGPPPTIVMTPVVPPPGIAVPQPQPGAFPPGFVPQAAPVIPPYDERTPSPLYPPVIPPTPPPQQGPFAPVIPAVGGYMQPPPPGPMYGPGPQMVREEPPVIPPSLSYTESSSSGSPRSEQEGITIIPPPPQLQQVPQQYMPGGQPAGPITIIPPPQEATVIRMPTSRAPSASPIRRYEDRPSEIASPRHSPPVIQVPGPTEPRVGSPRHPDAPSAQPMIISAPSQPPQPMAQPYITVQPQPMGPPQVIDVRPSSAGSPRSVAEDLREQRHVEPILRSERSPERPSSPPIIIQAPGQPVPGAMGVPPVVVERSPPRSAASPIVIRSVAPSRRAGSRSPEDRRRGTYRGSRSPSPIIVHPRTGTPSRSYREAGRRARSGSPTLTEEGSPEQMIVRVPTSRPRRSPSPRESYGDPRRQRVPSDREAFDPHRRRGSVSPSEGYGRPVGQPTRSVRSGSPHRERTRSQRSRPIRSPSPGYSEAEEPRDMHRPPRSERSERQPRSLREVERSPPPRSRRISPPISEGEEPSSPVLPVRSPSRQSPVPVRTGSRREEPRRSAPGPPTFIELPEHEHAEDIRPGTPAERAAHIIRVPASRPGRGRRMSDVTQRPHTAYEEHSPHEELERVELARSPSNVSEMQRAYGDADRRTPAVSRLPTQRSALDRGLTPRTEIAAQPEEEPTVPYSPSVTPAVERMPTVSRAPRSEGARPRFEERFEEPQGEEHYEEPQGEEHYEEPQGEEHYEELHDEGRHEEPHEVPYTAPRDEGGAPVIVPEPGRRVRTPAPSAAVEHYRASGPGDLGFEDAERERHERFGELERRMADALTDLQNAEEGREQDFRANEDAREHVFEDNEHRRDQEAIQRRDEIYRELEERLASIIPPPPAPPPAEPAAVTEVEVAPSTEGLGAPPTPPEAHVEEVAPGAVDARSVIESIRSVSQDAATRHAQEILETVRLEREELARERERAEATHARREEERDARIRALEDENAALREENATLREQTAALREESAATRAELENGQLRLTEDNERREQERADLLERYEAMRTQLDELTNLVSEQREELASKRELMDQRWNEKQEWRQQDNTRWTELREMVEQIIEDREAEKARMEEERAARADEPTNQAVLDEVANLKAHQDDILRQMSESWRDECAQMHERTLEAVKSTAQEQIPFNIQYLDEFSRSLASEVRMLLGEVGKLREERRNLQYEIGCMMTFKAKMGPSGEFDPNWRPPTGPCARDATGAAPPAQAPPAEGPPPPEEPVAARPGWRSVIPRGSRRSRRTQAAAPPPEPAPEVRPPVASWSTWQPNPGYAPTPATTQVELLAPPQESPGLFGPRSPRGSLQQ